MQSHPEVESGYTLTDTEATIKALKSYYQVNKFLVKKFGSDAALYLGWLEDQFFFYSDKGWLQEDGSFWTTINQVEEALGFSDRTVRRCKQIWIEEGVVLNQGLRRLTQKDSVQYVGTVKEFLRLDLDRVNQILLEEIRSKVGGSSSEGGQSDPRDNASDGLAMNGEKVRVDPCDNARVDPCDNARDIYKLNHKEEKPKHKSKAQSHSRASSGEDGTGDSEKDSPPLSRKEKNKIKREQMRLDCTPTAKRIAAIVMSDTNTKIQPQRVHQWANVIRLMVEQDGIDLNRQSSALDFYEKHRGEPYIPVIDSAASFRKKFVSLEKAIQRGQSTPTNGRPVNGHPHNGTRLSALKLAKEYFPASGVYLMIRNELPKAHKLVGKREDRGVVMYHYIQLHKYITDAFNRAVKANPRCETALENPYHILYEYLLWLDRQDWISEYSLKLLDPQSGFFKRFCKFYANEVNFDLLTGDSIYAYQYS